MQAIKLDLPFTLPSESTLLDYYRKRNKVLVIRDVPAIGDLLMLRMIFEDMKVLCPDAEITLSVPGAKELTICEHPFLDKVIDSKYVNLADYMVSYNLTSACVRSENATAPYGTEHRSDIWANHCGFELSHHNMHLHVSDDVTKRCRKTMNDMQKGEHKPIVLLSPHASVSSRSLDIEQSQGIIDGLREMGFFVLILHKVKLDESNVHTVVASTVIDFLGFINAADYIVTVDTAAFHAAGGLHKPTVAVFSWTDGKVYGKWYDNFILVQRHRDDGNWSCGGPCYYWHKCPLSSGPRKPCITTITAEEVLEAVKKMMNRWPLRN